MPPMRMIAPIGARQALPDATDPCTREHILLGWGWKGSCIDKLLTQTTTKFSLKVYKGITTSLEFSSNDKSQAGSKFLVGEGTGPSDIVGKVNGKTFPFYGSKGIKCRSWAARGAFRPCEGKVFLYVTGYNLTDRSLVFKELPKATIVDKALPNGKPCMMVELFSANTDPSWEMYEPVSVKVVNGKLSNFPSLGLDGQVVLSQLSGQIFGYSCR